ncbi:hypothetical protein AC578_10148 [Pseudocercospora eumusae]|uniref:G-protein coupled receptors family 2 profile 2 domain-containing protein n=1 Tax=Pseudocercospora eumusae TaxID=321146 RepID=A0A139HYS9_9PEZI|nr:hypothetical protein AC578_10148 [Pseudocercospora eumusae]
MANSTLLGNCVAPFLDAAQFSRDGGFIDGRFCAPIVELPGQPTCCLPCPATKYAYSDSFNTYNVVSEWLNVLGLILLTFMLLSYVLLPAQQTRSHYLSVCLVVSVMMITLGFTIPLGATPEQCYDAITPNDMYTSNACAWGGAFIIAGGLTAMMWIFIRALSMNLQICWDIVPGRKFFYISQLAGWGVPAILFTITITITGVSFRFGNACHVNHENSMGDFWGPLLAMAGMAAILQVGTFGYCIHVYLKNLWTDASDVSTNASSGGLPSYQGSVRTMTARAVYRRLKKVLWLQWRGICIVSIVLVDVIFFSIVFVSLDGMQVSITNDLEKVKPWLFCLAQHPNDKNKCLPLVQGWLVNEPTVVAVLLLLALMGLQVFLLLTRPSFFPAWWHYFRSKVSPKHQEFVSLDARHEIMRSNSNAELLKYQRGHQATTFEMQSKPPFIHTADLDTKKNNTTSSTPISPDETYRSPLSRRESPAIDPTSPTFGRGRIPPEYIGRITPSPGDAGSAFPTHALYQREPNESFDPPPTAAAAARRYRAPNSSFAQPNAPTRTSSTRSMTHTYSRGGGGLAMNPPGEIQEDASYEFLREKNRF